MPEFYFAPIFDTETKIGTIDYGLIDAAVLGEKIMTSFYFEIEILAMRN